MNKTEKIASTLLGKRVSASESYDPSVLVAIPRFDNRKQYQIDDNNLPFKGFDIWHAYEFSSMTENGLPVTRLMKMQYNADSKYIVESKSLKLYLNSFNMTRYGNSIEECLDICKKVIEKDLSQALSTDVKINFFDNSISKTEIFQDYKNILEYVDEKLLKIDKFKEAPELIKIESTANKNQHKLKFDSLRSNCRVTHQPDFGDVFIFYESNKHLKEDSLVKYLCSFRSEFHFHEECCEMIYKRLYDLLDKQDKLLVCILYTRRGGIDISPVRFSKDCDIIDVEQIINIEKYARCGIKQ